ncbi:RNA 2'-phosphotransferase [Desmospora activa]|uniref:Probable RNA 2'-phosphotransferase n=1 Tax=Desmospora activa DSM 45169 TaxID=1121389 RepID=A0A2T4Z9I3_9BACL|nr:RNA 2'-phosphotransferase [Desmospora activa]PTM58550.1 putative RNA 2'-phosphotransferase [Desmospora activa DSM 45169]
MKREDIQQSKFLSLILRHRPERVGIQLEAGGWVEVDRLLTACRQHGMPIDRATLERLVKTNDKQRFAFNEDGSKIRANQGHSLSVNLGLKPVQPPLWLYHGTARQFLPSIEKQGLLKRNRHHVHLSGDPQTAIRVGKRHGRPVVLKVGAKEMAADGYTFYRSDNGVWLTKAVPPRYLEGL